MVVSRLFLHWNSWGFFIEKIMKEPESIADIIDGMIESVELEQLEAEADKWDALTFEQKYGLKGEAIND